MRARSNANRIGRYSMVCSRVLIVAILASIWGLATLVAQTANVAPVARQQVFDDNGDPLAGAKLYTFDTGTTTPRTTYSDAALSSANANPVVADAFGRFGAIFLSPVAYRFRLETSAGTTIYTQDNVSALAAAADIATINTTITNMGGGADLFRSDGRCTLTSALPVTTSDVTAATTLFYTPYAGNQITLRNSSGTWQTITFTELSLALGADAADTNYDLWVYNSGGTATLERLAWSSSGAGSSTRATALATQNGVLVKSGDPTRRYVCTYRTTGVVGQTEDSVAKRFVWNYRNRVPRTMQVLDSTNSWVYTTNTWRQAGALTSNQLAFVIGVAEVPLDASIQAYASNPTVTQVASIAVGLDTTTAPTTGNRGMDMRMSVSNAVTPGLAMFQTYPSAGYHFAAWLEINTTASGTTTWYGDNNTPTLLQSGIAGDIPGDE